MNMIDVTRGDGTYLGSILMRSDADPEFADSGKPLTDDELLSVSAKVEAVRVYGV